MVVQSLTQNLKRAAIAQHGSFALHDVLRVRGCKEIEIGLADARFSPFDRRPYDVDRVTHAKVVGRDAQKTRVARIPGGRLI